MIKQTIKKLKKLFGGKQAKNINQPSTIQDLYNKKYIESVKCYSEKDGIYFEPKYKEKITLSDVLSGNHVIKSKIDK
jgi:outer membrane protein assembly factor BamA